MVHLNVQAGDGAALAACGTIARERCTRVRQSANCAECLGALDIMLLAGVASVADGPADWGNAVETKAFAFPRVLRTVALAQGAWVTDVRMTEDLYAPSRWVLWGQAPTEWNYAEVRRFIDRSFPNGAFTFPAEADARVVQLSTHDMDRLERIVGDRLRNGVLDMAAGEVED